MSNNKKYVSLSRLQTFLENLSNKFAALSHKHKMSDITDYKVDTALSSTSNNPIANSAVDAEFEAIATAMNALDLAIDGKANAIHSHAISEVTNLQTSLDAKVPTSRTVNGKALTTNITLSASDVGAAASSHDHNGLYYTETEIDTKLASKSDTTHKHDNLYDAKGSASDVQDNLDAVSDTLDAHTGNTDVHVTTANKSNWNAAYTHSTSAHARTDATKVEDSTTNGNIKINGTETNVYSHPNSGVTAGTYKSVTVNAQGHVTAGSNPTTLSGYGITDAETKTDASAKLTEAKSYADTAATKVKNDLLNGAGSAYDTLKELGDLISENVDAIDALETVAAGKADKTHSHVIADVSGLQSALDGKAASSHGTHVSYSTTAPVMDGTASTGSASTVARSDHKHPTDTSRASKTEFDTHNSDTTKHITSTERTNWNAAKSHADSAHAPSNAEKNQNAFSNITIGSTTVSADTTTDTITFVGSNVTITPDATNDKITFAVADGSTSAKGVVQLTNSTSSTSTTTAATPSSVKSAYDLANTAKTNAATAQTRADSAYTLAESKVDSLSDLGITATATELNYVDGVTSNIQTQLDAKVPASRTVNGKALSSNITLSASDVGAAASSHNHSASNITSGTLSVERGGTGNMWGYVQAGALEGSSIGALATAEGRKTTASGDYSHAEGNYTEAIGSSAHAEGQNTAASGVASHAEGENTTASGNYSHAEGENTIASSKHQHVQGKFNKEDSSGTYAHIVGNGTGASSSSRSNAHTLDWNGNAWYAGDIYVGGKSQNDTAASRVTTEADHEWNLIHDSGAITSRVNSISNINVSGYKKLLVAVKCVNSANSAARAGSVIFKASNGTTYQFPVLTNLFTTSAATAAGMAEFDIIDGYIICPYASRNIKTSNFMSSTEGGTADNLTNTGGGIMKCTNDISSLTVSSLDQNSSFYFESGSRVFVWGCNA